GLLDRADLRRKVPRGGWEIAVDRRRADGEACRAARAYDADTGRIADRSGDDHRLVGRADDAPDQRRGIAGVAIGQQIQPAHPIDLTQSSGARRDRLDRTDQGAGVADDGAW